MPDHPLPDFRTYIRQNLTALGVPGDREAELIEELVSDFEERYERAIRGGADPAEAWNKTKAQIQELSLELRAILGDDHAAEPEIPRSPNPMKNFVNALRLFAGATVRDIRHGARMLRKSPGFTAIAVVTLALCLGANLTIFAVIDSILLRPLPFSQADRLVTTVNSYPLSGSPRGSASIPNYYDYREKIKAFASTAIISWRSEPAIIGEAGSPRRVERDRVSPEFFSTLGVSLLMGRSFTEEEMVPSRSRVAILNYAFWRNYFNADPHVLGRTFKVDGSPVTVVGVLPPHFRYLSKRAQFYTPAAWAPWERELTQRHNNRFQLIARLAPGTSIATARAQIATLNAEQFKDDPFAAMIKGWGFFTMVNGLHEDHVQSIRPILLLLEGGVLFLLLIGGVNLVNLLLIRASGRAKELAVRQSLGASRLHVVSQVMTETVLLTLTGGLLGLAIAAGGIQLLTALGADQLPLGTYIAFDGRLALIAVLGAVVFGILIAAPIVWFTLRGHLANALHSESRSGTANRAAQRLRHSFIVAQIALAFVLLTGAGLLGVSLKHVLETSPGFQTERVLTGQISLSANHYQDEKARLAFVERLVSAMQAQPGVSSAGVGNLVPFGGDESEGITAVEGAEMASGSSQHAHYRNGVVGNYWQTMGIPLLEGRLLENADRERRVCVVDEAFAQRYWPGKSALGHRLNDGPVFQRDNAFTIVGVVSTVKQNQLDDTKPLGTVYYPYQYWSDPAISVVARTNMAPEALAPALRKTVLQLDSELPIDNLKPMQNRIDESLVTRRSPAMLAGIFAGVALLLTAVGTYGVLAYAVSQRRREIGVRMALGALPQQVLTQFLGLGAKLLLAGITLGLLGAWAAGRAMQSQLFGIGSLHPGVLAVTAGVMVSVVLLATFVPSHRASRVSPTEALRDE